ncbi:MAG TPA: hypothetical protein VEB20_01020 [Azospirillaceae bacterium]|nr:hypothetical protein [Azospirillaceae bacterium]
MGKISILWDIASDQGTLAAAGSDPAEWVESGGLSVQNLRTDDVQAFARYLDIGSSTARLVVDMGRPRPVSGFAIINHNAATTGIWQPGLSNNADLSSPLYLPDALPFWEPTVVWGSVPFGAFPFDLVDKDTFPGVPIAYHLASETHFPRYLWVDIEDPDNEAGYWQGARLLAGQAYTPPWNFSYGASVRPVDPSEVRRTRGGRRMVRRLPKYRQWRITLEHQTEEAAIGVYHDLMWRLGKSGDMLLVWDPDKDAALRNRLTLYCALVDTTEITLTSHNRWSWSFDVEEII